MVIARRRVRGERDEGSASLRRKRGAGRGGTGARGGSRVRSASRSRLRVSAGPTCTPRTVVSPVPTLPVIMGHEGAGIVDAVGKGVSGIREGDRVLLLPSETCGACPACDAGHLGLCPSARILGMARDGTFAEKIAVPSSCALPLPDGISFEHGAILADAVATAYHAVATRAGIRGGERIAVIGCGGVGHHAILVGKAARRKDDRGGRCQRRVRCGGLKRRVPTPAVDVECGQSSQGHSPGRGRRRPRAGDRVRGQEGIGRARDGFGGPRRARDRRRCRDGVARARAAGLLRGQGDRGDGLDGLHPSRARARGGAHRDGEARPVGIDHGALSAGRRRPRPSKISRAIGTTRCGSRSCPAGASS